MTIYLPERDLILYLLQHEYFKTYYEYIDLPYIKENHRELFYLYQAVKALHERFPDRDHTLEGLQAFFTASYPDADRELYSALFETLKETVLDPEVGVGILKQIKERQQALKLSEELVKFATGYSDLEKVKEKADELLSQTSDSSGPDIEVVSDDLDFLLESAVAKSGLRWRLNCLNRSLGSLRQGDFGFVFKRPETGGTAFLASEGSFMLENLSDDIDAPILWLNMEEQGNKVMLRVYQSFFGVTLPQLFANKAKYKAEFQKKVAGRLKMVDNAGITRQEVEALCKRYKPCLILQDQTSKVKGFDADREDLKLGKIFQWSRELAKDYCPIIGVHQADGSAENIKWLTMEHVANVKTAAQAEADWILGIGCTHSEGTENLRYLNISKNKLMGDSDSLPELRHGKFEVYLEQDVQRYKDIVNYD